MNKKEFLDVLRQTLAGEVSSSTIDQNLQYYNQYISSRGIENEEKVIEELGDPRLIAKTIILTDKSAKQKGQFRENESQRSYYEDGEDYKDSNYRSANKQNGFNKMSWTSKLSMILILIAVILVVVIIGRVIIGFLFAFGIPIILVLLLISLFKKRN
ncbi:MAG: putative rane protein [Herbinix sp.]|jgi:uncharacterized membrane protein|nr:putative rane protein [Herbinix sp.]